MSTNVRLAVTFFSQLQKMSDAPLADCPVCHKAELQKLVSASSFQLKGSGWYATDFKSTPTTNDNTAAPAAETKNGQLLLPLKLRRIKANDGLPYDAI